MVVMKSKDAQRRFGGMVDAARKEPVTITRNDRPVVVVIDHEYYQHLMELEDECWPRVRAPRPLPAIWARKSAEVLREMLDAN